MMSSQRRTSRPSSAASYSSRTSYNSNSELKLECRAAFLSQYDDIREEIESKDKLTFLLQETGRNPSLKTIDRYWQDGMTFDDFVDVCKKEPVTSEDDLMKAFRKIDANGDGFISLDELFKVMTTRGEKMTRSEVKAMIEEVDENNDGKLDYREFSKMVISTSEDFKKASIKMMEKRERKKKGLTPRKERDELSVGSQVSVRSVRSNYSEKYDRLDKPSPRGRRESRPKSGRGTREPSSLRDWTKLVSKGTFFLEQAEGIRSHVFSLTLTEDSDVWITIQPLMIGESGANLDGTIIDTALFVLEDDGSFVAFTENRDETGKYSVRCSLSQGTYSLIPFTTGCRLKPSQEQNAKEAKIVSKDKEGNIVLTRAFKKALGEIFDMADLDGNGLLSRDEFNWYNLRTSEETVADDEWQVVMENVDLEHGEIPRSGFLKLVQMEAEDNEGDTEDLWITLNNMGFNSSLLLDKACPFELRVFTHQCTDPELNVTDLRSSQEKIDAAACHLVIQKGERTPIKTMKDLSKYCHSNDHRATIVLLNESKSTVKVEVDCSANKKLVSHSGSMIRTVKVPGRTSVVAHYLLPIDDRVSEFRVTSEETILK